GGELTGAGNTIAFNGPTGEIGVGTGIEVLGGNGNSIRGNSIFSIARLGIDLDGNGVTPNDPGDSDSGGNKRQNFPLIISVIAGPDKTPISGTLNSAPNATFAIDFYSNASCDSSGNGEGAMPFGLSSIPVTTDANGNGIFDVTLSILLRPGRVITATATDQFGNTSEFSPCNQSKAMGSAQFNSASYTVIEDVGSATMTVNRVGGSSGILTVDYSTTNISATAGQDYVATSGTLTFADGETTKNVDVPILDDLVNESDESLAVLLRNPTDPDAVGNSNTAVLKIQDDSTIPVLSINSVSINEGDTGTTNAVFTVSLFPATGRTVTANYSTLGLEATSGVDFQSVSGSITFNPRATTQTVSVPIIGDTSDEFDERFRLRLTNLINAAVGSSGIGTIIDEDPPPTISVSDVSVNEGNSGTTTVFFTVSLSSPSGKPISVVYGTADGTASSGSDYVAATGTITLSPGETNKTLAIIVNGDNEAEPDESFFINLKSTTNANIAGGQGKGTILSDDGTVVPLQLILDESGPDPIQAAALDSLLFLRDPFPVLNGANVLNQGPDRNTRIIIFVMNLQLNQGE
ncbi:MAG: Calx-beta domain-containing protein, partial [Candidatus Udaeobacter sp.]